MLQALRDRVMGVLGWIIIGLIIITFALFGLSSYLQNHARLYAAKVNDVEITPRDLQLAYQNQRAALEQMLGDAFNPAVIDEQKLKQQALDNLINRQLILQAAEADGMTVSDQLLAARIHAMKAFQKDGGFDAGLYQSRLAQRGQTPAGFEHELRLMMIGQQLTDGVTDTGFVTDAEVDRVYRLQRQTRSFDYVTVEAAPIKAELNPDDAAVKAWYEAHSDAYVTPQRVRLAYIRLDPDVLGKQIDVSDQEVQDYYEQKKSSLKTQEQRRASHILFPVAADADEASVEKTRAEAEKVLQQIRDGGDFAQLAEKYSGDPGSAKQGGDLGWFSAGAMVPEFDKTVFAMQPGEVSDLVRTQFGFHIIKLTDVKRSEIPPLDEVREQLVSELKQRRINDLYYEQIEQLTNKAYENPGSLQPAADALGLEIKTSDWITADAGPGIGQYPAVRTAAFSDDVLESGNNSEPLEVGQDDAIVVRVVDREAAHPTPLADVRERIVAELKQQQAAQTARERGDNMLRELEAGKSLKAVAESGGYSVKSAHAAGRDAQGYPPGLVNAVFRMGHPAQDKPVDKGIALANGDYVVVSLTAVADADPAAMSDAERTQLKQGIGNMQRNVALAAMLDELRRNAQVEIPKENETP